MKLRFENNLNDLVAFNLHYWERSAAAQRAFWYQRWLPSAVIVAVTLLSTIATGMLWKDMAVALIILGIPFAIATAWYFWFPGHYWRNIDRSVRQLFADGSNDRYLGTQELELGDEMLIARNGGGESRTKYSMIVKLETTKLYVLVYLSSFAAHVIPLHESIEGDPLLFRDALQRRIDGISESAIRSVSDEVK
jgi:hypothetical protein